MTRHRQLSGAKAAAVLAAIPILLLAYIAGPDPGKTGAPGESTCAGAGCHTGTVNSGQGSVRIDAGGTSYQPGVKQRIKVTVSDPVQRRWGFQLTTSLAISVRVLVDRLLPNTEIQVAAAILAWKPAPLATPLCEMTGFIPPAPGINVTLGVDAVAGVLRVVVRGVAGCIEHDVADIGRRRGPIEVKRGARGGAGPGARRGVLDVLQQRGAAAGLLQKVGVTAQDLGVAVDGGETARLGPGRAYAGVVNGKLPTTLDGVSLMVNGNPAFPYSISPGLVTAQSPSDSVVGPVNVVVTLNGVASDPVPVPFQTFSPAFFLWPGGVAVATDPNFNFRVKPGTFPGATTVAANPDEVIILWGTGFGPSNPDVPAGQLVPADRAYNIANPATVTVGSITAEVFGAALAPFNASVVQVAFAYLPTLRMETCRWWRPSAASRPRLQPY